VVGIIYIVRNRENGRIYIGQTTKSLLIRQRQHESEGRKTNPSGLLDAAIGQFGEDAFDWEVIDRANSFAELNEKERWWIRFFNSTVPEFGYNTRHGGYRERQEGPLCYRENPTPSSIYAYWLTPEEFKNRPNHNFIIHKDSGLLFWDEETAARSVNRNIEWVRGKLSYRSEWDIYNYVDPEHYRNVSKRLIERSEQRLSKIDELIKNRDKKRQAHDSE